jgi:small subunit ribosomal protein S8
MRDNLSDMITRIRNGQKTGNSEILLYKPTPNFCLNILTLLENEGFIRGFRKIISNNQLQYVVLLKYTLNNEPVIKKIERVSTPGKRIYIRSKHV